MISKRMARAASVFLVALSGTFSGASQGNVQPTGQIGQRTLSIVPGQGVFKSGTKRADLERVVGKGEAGGKYDAVYYLYYPAAGLEVSLDNKTDTVQSIFIHNEDFPFKPFTRAQVRTVKGIGWNATINTVMKAYGKPKTDFSPKDKSWRRLVYVGIDFLFEGGKLERIGILGRDEI